MADTIHILFLLLLDSTEIAGLIGIAWLLKLFVKAAALPPIAIGTWTVDAEQIIKNFDYGVLLAFLFAQALRMLLHLFRKRLTHD